VSTGEATLREAAADFNGRSGKLLRIDVERPTAAVPGNPDSDAEYPARIVYASGLRNPSCFDVDSVMGAMAAADAGTDAYEELNLVKPGATYGFPWVEGPASHEGSVEPALCLVST